MFILRFILDYFKGSVVHYAPPEYTTMKEQVIRKTPNQLIAENREFYNEAMMDIHTVELYLMERE